jgi:thioredoxin-related protein
MTQLYLFVMDRCRPCHLVKTQLKRTPDWEKYVTIVENTQEEKSPLCEQYNIQGTPTLVAVKPNGEYMKFTSPSKMTKSFWTKLFTKVEEES